MTNTHPNSGILKVERKRNLAAARRVRQVVIEAMQSAIALRGPMPDDPLDASDVFATDTVPFHDAFSTIESWGTLAEARIVNLELGTIGDAKAVFILFEFDPMEEEHQSWLCIRASDWDKGPEYLALHFTELFEKAIKEYYA